MSKATSSILFSLLLLLVPPRIHGQNLLAMLVQEVEGNPMGRSSELDMDIVNQDYDACTMRGLTNFTSGEGKIYQGSDLRACNLFPLPGGTIPSLSVLHSGTDAFSAEWIRFLLDDSTWVDCGAIQADNERTKHTQCLPLN